MVAASLPDPVNRHQGEAEATMSDAVIDYRFARPPERPLALPAGPGPKVDEGAPDGRLFPVELLARAYRVAVQRASRDNGFQYRDPRGSPALREAIATQLKSRSEEHTSELQSLMGIT